MGSTRLVVQGSVIAELQVGGRVMEAAAERLYRASRTPVLRFFMNSGRLSTDEAEDVFQEMIIRVIKHAGTYNGSGNAAAWIWAIARNVLMDFFQSTNRRAVMEIPLTDFLASAGQVGTDDLPANDEGRGHLHFRGDDPIKPIESLATAPESTGEQSVDECFQIGFGRFREKMPERAHALEMILDGSSIEEIASLIDRSYDATKVYLSQCRKKMAPFVLHCRELLQ